jgi:transcriptional regulator with XRE-family HTH domain
MSNSTSAGRFLKKLRVDNNETAVIMAGKLGVTASFLSAVECGKREFPVRWLDEISSLYGLSGYRAKEFLGAVSETLQTIQVELGNLDFNSRLLLVKLVSSLRDISEAGVTRLLRCFGEVASDEGLLEPVAEYGNYGFLDGLDELLKSGFSG